jgi:hypothetical protein
MEHSPNTRGEGCLVESTSKPAAAVLGIVGGAVLVIGSVLPWAKVSLDLNKFAEVLGVDPSLMAGAGVETSQNVGGLDADGKFTLVAGIVVLVCAAILLARAKRWLGVLMLLGGLAGGGVAMFDIVSKDRQLDDALASAGPELEAIGLSADTFREVFTVSFSTGIYLCVIGGILAMIAGAMALMSTSEPDMVAASDAGVSGTGFDPSPPGTYTPPLAPPAVEAPPPGPAPIPPAAPEDPGHTPP